MRSLELASCLVVAVLAAGAGCTTSRSPAAVAPPAAPVAPSSTGDVGGGAQGGDENTAEPWSPAPGPAEEMQREGLPDSDLARARATHRVL